MINDRDSYTELNPRRKYLVEFPYMIGTAFKLKSNTDILAKIVQYRVEVKGYKEIIHVGLTTDVYSSNTEVEYEIILDELEEKWQKTDKIVEKINPVNFDLGLEYCSYIHSKDSEHIASLLEGFKYDPSKTDEVREKYERSQ